MSFITKQQCLRGLDHFDLYWKRPWLRMTYFALSFYALNTPPDLLRAVAGGTSSRYQARLEQHWYTSQITSSNYASGGTGIIEHTTRIHRKGLSLTP